MKREASHYTCMDMPLLTEGGCGCRCCYNIALLTEGVTADGSPLGIGGQSPLFRFVVFVTFVVSISFTASFT